MSKEHVIWADKDIDSEMPQLSGVGYQIRDAHLHYRHKLILNSCPY